MFFVSPFQNQKKTKTTENKKTSFESKPSILSKVLFFGFFGFARVLCSLVFLFIRMSDLIHQIS
jgi:hypothetical protein